MAEEMAGRPPGGAHGRADGGGNAMAAAPPAARDGGPPDPDPARPHPAPRGRRLWRLIPIALLAGGLVAFLLFAPDNQSVFQMLKAHRAVLTGWTAANPVLAALCFVLLYAAIAAFSLPVSALVTILGGFLFGTLAGTTLVVLGATAGAVTLFLAVRAAFADLFRARFGRRIARMERGLSENAFSYLLFLRLVPVFPFFLVNIAPAFFRVGVGIFALTTFLGIIPGTFVFANVGASLGRVLDTADRFSLQGVLTPDILLALCLLGLLALVPVAYGRWRGWRARGRDGGA